MTRDDMTAQIRYELEHIPDAGPAQKILRMLYNKRRFKSLGKNFPEPRTPTQDLQATLEELRQVAAAPLQYDTFFFQ